jgi:hypothetical protein
MPLQTELRFHSRRYEQPPTSEGLRDVNFQVARRRPLLQQRQRPSLRAAKQQQRWPQGRRCCDKALAHVSTQGARTSYQSQRAGGPERRWHRRSRWRRGLLQLPPPQHRRRQPPTHRQIPTQVLPDGRAPISTYPDGGDGAAKLGGTIHSGCGSPERGRSKPSATRASRSSAVTVEKGHGSRGETTVTRSAITKRRGWRRSGQGARFSFSGYSLRLRKPKQEASNIVKNHHQSLFRIYKGPGKTRSTLRPNPPQNSKLEGETPVPRTGRATAASRTTRPVALTPRQGRRHLWQAKRATLHLRHDDRVKKGAPRRSISYPFPLPLSLSYYRD